MKSVVRTPRLTGEHRFLKRSRKITASAILDRRENAERIAFGDPPHARTRSGQERLAARLSHVLKETLQYEYIYRHRPPQMKSPEEIEKAIRFREFSRRFCADAIARSQDYDRLSHSAATRRAHLADAKHQYTELERLFYAIEMDLPRPPHLRIPDNVALKSTPH
jgi:hypothetical protein